MCLWLHIDQFICRSKGCLIMPVWLDAIPEKAPKVARPGTGRWLLFLAFVMLAGIALTLWCWTSERTGFVFWFTALGLPFCTGGLFSAYAGLPTKPNRWGPSPEMSSEKRLLTVKFCAVNAAPDPRYLYSESGRKQSR